MCDRPVIFVSGEPHPEVQLPIEIWEIILKNLTTSELLVTASVCSQWRHLARGLCRERCQRLPSRLQLELRHEYLQNHVALPSPSDSRSLSASPSPTPDTDLTHLSECTETQRNNSLHQVLHIKDASPFTERSNYPGPPQDGAIDWLALASMLDQTDITPEPERCSITRQLENITHLNAAGSFAVAVSWNSETSSSLIYVVSGSGEGDHCWQHHIAGRVLKVCVIETPDNPPVLAICVERDLQCYLVRPNLHTLSPLSVFPTITVDSRLCCDGSTLVVSDIAGVQQLALYEAVPIPEEGKVELILIGRIQTSSPAIHWDLWNGFVTAVVSGGHVSSYTVTGNLVAESPLYKDLRYPNPTVLTRGLILASTVTSRTLLAYWHMDRDRDYWLLGESVLASWVKRGQMSVGNTSKVKRDYGKIESTVRQDPVSPVLSQDSQVQVFPESASICILTLAKIRVGRAFMTETTAIHYKRGLVFCGTSQGHVLVYKLLLESNAKNTLVDWTVLENLPPVLTLSVSTRPVSRLVSYFHKQFTVVAVGDRNGNCFIVSIPVAEYASDV